MRILYATAFLAALAGHCHAGQTRTWTEAEYADFEKGNLKKLSLRSDGLVTIAPRFDEIFDSSSAYLWTLAQDSKGNVYTGGGPGAKLFRLTPKGEHKTLAELEGLEIHAIAVDSKDRVYAATAPDGKVYRVSSSGKPEIFYDPKAKYIWALAFDSKGNLFVATGDKGEIHKVGPDGKGSVFFKTDETHARSMTVDRQDNLIVGTDPSGLVFRISPAGEGFVLYQMSKKEVTSVAVAADGAIYAAAVGNKSAAAPPFQPAPTPAPAPAPVTGAATGTVTVAARPSTPPPTMGSAAASISGGSEVYRISPQGDPHRVWTHGQDIVYTIGFDPSGRVLLGSGNKGVIYRIDSDTLYTALLNAPPTQITALETGRDGRIYAATGNIGKVYAIGPGVEKEGTIESQVHDTAIYSQWGRLNFEAKLNGGQVSIQARSGNVDHPGASWSQWSAPITETKGMRINVPPARFVQWKATLTTSASGQSPQLESVDVAYLPKNIAPRVEVIEVTPVNYRFPVPAVITIAAPQTLALPPIGKRSGASAGVSLDTSNTPAMQYAKGSLGARWSAADDNGDTLQYTVQIRGESESEWKPLKDKFKEKYVSFDSTAYPDGEYRIRVIASDSPSNPPSEALTGEAVSDPFVIDNTGPVITGLTAARSGSKLTVRWHAADALNSLKRAEYSLDGGEWTIVAPVSRLSDSPELDYEIALDAAPGEHTIAVRVEDDYDNQSAAKKVVR